MGSALVFWVLAGAAGSRAVGGYPGEDDEALEFFEKRVRPVLEERCLSCHSSKLARPKGRLVLDSRAGWERGAALGPAVVPGDPDASPLVRAVRYDDFELQMPPTGKLPQAEIDALVEWVRRGAVDPRALRAEGGAEESASPEASGTAGAIAPQEHWAFRAMGDPLPPQLGDGAWVRNDIDRFVLQRLEREGLAPAPPAMVS